MRRLKRRDNPHSSGGDIPEDFTDIISDDGSLALSSLQLFNNVHH
jgi:hypothetical protein